MADAVSQPTLRLTVRERTVDLPLRGSVRIGSDPRCDVVVRRAELDPVHVRVVACGAGRFAVEDVSVFGVVVNGERLVGRRPLRHGDVLAFGLARMEFAAAEALTPSQALGPIAAARNGAAARGSAAPRSSPAPPSAGPQATTAKPPGVSPTPAASVVCAVCHCPIEPTEADARCSSCGLPFHADCWRENFGCSAYGCDQVDVLRAGPDLKLAADEVAVPAYAPAPAGDAEPEDDSIPYDHLLLAASVAAACVGLCTYGLPAGGVALASGRRLAALLRERRAAARPGLEWSEQGWRSAAARPMPPWPWLTAVATVVSIVAALGGGVASAVLYSH